MEQLPNMEPTTPYNEQASGPIKRTNPPLDEKFLFDLHVQGELKILPRSHVP